MFNPNDPNVVMLEKVALRLGPALCRKVVFVGGAAAGLLITDLAAPTIRRTDDVDIVTKADALADYYRIEDELRSLGFVEDQSPEAPVCRWRVDGVAVDVMPTLKEILGFANRWYLEGEMTAQWMTLPNGLQIRVVRAPEFIAIKLEAFYGRGGGDYLFSHDMGDIIGVIDGRESLFDECLESLTPLKGYLAAQFKKLLSDRRFVDALPGHLPPDGASQARFQDLLFKLTQISNLHAGPPTPQTKSAPTSG
jgi:predicted nucleotidyltransferase